MLKVHRIIALQSTKLPKDTIPQGYPQISILYPQLGPQVLLRCRASGQKIEKFYRIGGPFISRKR